MRGSGALALALSLSACVLGTKVGDLPEGTGGTEAAGTGGDSSGKQSSSGGATETEGPVSSGDDTATDGPVTSSGPLQGACEGLDEATCAAVPECRVQLGSAFRFMDCPVGPQFLGCIAAETACDEALTPVCRDGTGEVYLNNDGCVPAGFTQCATELPLCGACDELNEEECLAQPQECQGLYGAPHVEQQGVECVDFTQSVFLACAANGGACPPFVPTVCPIGDPSTKFDVPSGCVPFGFETCEPGAPECP